MYSLVRPLLFALEPETAHHVTLNALRAVARAGLAPASRPAPASCARTVMGLRFPNPVGLAAGLDKNGDYIDALAGLGFGFLEVGTVTPRAQPGNPRPRLFRIPAAALAPATTVVAQKVGEIVLDDPATTHDRPVAADISADGSMIVVKTMELTWFWTRATGQTVMQALAASPCPPEALGSGEAIAFDASGGQIATLAEGRGKPLFRYRRS